MEPQNFSVNQVISLAEEVVSYLPSNLHISGEVRRVRIFKDFIVFFELAEADSSINIMITLPDLKGEVPAEGAKVIVVGEIQLGRKAELRVRARKLLDSDELGSGAIKFEQLKKQMRTEGLFDDARKKPLPRFPRSVALITSADSSAYHDFMRISGNRFPATKITLYPSTVQGQVAEQEVCSKLKEIFSLIKKSEQFDVIAIVRGGGSKADLEVFNSEKLARLAASSPIPLVSGVGHEDDISLLDLVADRRASTPSNAAELIFPDRFELRKEVNNLYNSLSKGLMQQIQNSGLELDAQIKDLQYGIKNRLSEVRSKLSNISTNLNALDFQQIYARGFASLTIGDQSLVSIKDVKKGDSIAATMIDGRLDLKVTAVRKEA